MSEKATTNRQALVKASAAVRPALATQDFIPALTHILFADGYATAYNDIAAISVRCQVEVERLLPGELLIKGLGSFSADQIVFQEGKNGALVLSSGRAKMTIPTLDPKVFPLSWPAEDDGHEIELGHAILKGIERCLISVGNDPTHPAQMGVTLDIDDAKMAVLFSTDNFTISRYQTKNKIKLPGDTPVILPRFFCEQLVSLAKTYSEEEITLVLHDGALLVEFGKMAKLFTRTPVDLEPLDFPSNISKVCKLESLKSKLEKIPDSFDAAFGRALLVLSAEVDKATKISPSGSGFKLSSSSSMGDSDDSMDFDGDLPDDPFHVDPSMIARASKACALIGFLPRAVVMSDADINFIHLVAHCAA